MTRRRGIAGILVALILLGVVAFLSLRLFPKFADERNYPLQYRDEILAASDEFSLDPNLVAAMIYCESSFRADAVSSVGAIGLMQIMPETGEWVAGKLGDAYADENLYDPATNIRYGCWYLAFLMERFEGEDVVLAAYNAGHGNVAKWLKDEAYSDDGKTLHTIPNSQPRQYVTKVKKAYEAYQRLYDLKAGA